MFEKRCPTCQWRSGRRVKVCDLCRAAGVPEPPREEERVRLQGVVSDPEKR